MKNLGRKFALIGIITLCGLYFLWPPEEQLKTGIDLSGGTILVYEVKQENLPRGFKMDELIASLKKRINPEGVLDIPIRKMGSNRFEIILPKATAEEVDEVKRKITDVGSLVFRILANRKYDRRAIDRALGPNGLKNPPRGYYWAQLGEVISGTKPRFDATTITVPGQSWAKNKYAGLKVELTGKDASGKQTNVTVALKGNTSNTLILATRHRLSSIDSFRLEYNPSGIVGSTEAIVREETTAPGRVEKFLLVKEDRENVNGEYLTRVYQTQDERLQPAVGFVFNHTGARKFGKLTGSHLPEEGGAFKFRLAIVLDNLVMSAPSINSEIRDTGIIEGGGQGFQPKEVEHLISILQAGSLPATINPVPLQEENVGPTLGEDTIRKGINAILISMLTVPIFMVIYYRFAGAVAVVALVLNMILLISSMALFQSSFTLPGLAGLALTIGMSVDANVLIFERIREEAERGASMAQQIRNGFSRAWATIFDSHVTVLLSGIVLYAVGTEEIKGFALTLIIGMIWNLFTAVYVSRVIFDFWYAKGWLKRVTMLKMFDKTNIDFVGPRRYFMAASVVVITLGLVAAFVRGNGLFNIDFTGGTLVTIRLNDQAPAVKSLSPTQRTSYVRETAMKALPDVTVESLNVEADKERGVRFNIRTTNQDVKRVQSALMTAFGKNLALVEMSAGQPTRIAAPAAEKEKESAEKGSAAPTKAERFAGGWSYPLTFNAALPPARVAAEFGQVLAKTGLANPDTHFEVIDPNAPPGSSPDTPPREKPYTLQLRTDLEPSTARADLNQLATALRDDPNLLFERLTTFGGIVAGETRILALIATVASWVIIIVYLWFRFKSLTYGLAAIIAVVHDVLVTLGAVAVTYWLAQVPGLREALMLDQFKIDLPMTAAFLTLIGFSVNDTIVIFDRIREIKGRSPHLTPKLVNDAVNQTLSRTILTTLTAWIVVFVLYIFGGEGLHGFAFCLVVGFISGTYSTVYIASPILIDWISAHEKPPTPETAELVAANRR